MTEQLEIYERPICDCYHPTWWDGDCREDGARFGSPEEYAEAEGVSVYDVQVIPMEEIFPLLDGEVDDGEEGET